MLWEGRLKTKRTQEKETEKHQMKTREEEGRRDHEKKIYEDEDEMQHSTTVMGLHRRAPQCVHCEAFVCLDQVRPKWWPGPGPCSHGGMSALWWNLALWRPTRRRSEVEERGGGLLDNTKILYKRGHLEKALPLKDLEEEEEEKDEVNEEEESKRRRTLEEISEEVVRTRIRIQEEEKN